MPWETEAHAKVSVSGRVHVIVNVTWQEEEVENIYSEKCPNHCDRASQLQNRKTLEIPKIGEKEAKYRKQMEKNRQKTGFSYFLPVFSPISRISELFYSVAGRRTRNPAKKEEANSNKCWFWGPRLDCEKKL